MARKSSRRAPERARARIAAVAGCLFALGIGASGAVLAADAPPEIRVSYADLDLTTDQGVQTLYRRLVAAAEQVCPSAPMQHLSLYVQSRACQKKAVAEAVRQIGSPRLAALLSRHDAHG